MNILPGYTLKKGLPSIKTIDDLYLMLKKGTGRIPFQFKVRLDGIEVDNLAPLHHWAKSSPSPDPRDLPKGNLTIEPYLPEFLVWGKRHFFLTDQAFTLEEQMAHLDGLYDPAGSLVYQTYRAVLAKLIEEQSPPFLPGEDMTFKYKSAKFAARSMSDSSLPPSEEIVYQCRWFGLAGDYFIRLVATDKREIYGIQVGERYILLGIEDNVPTWIEDNQDLHSSKTCPRPIIRCTDAYMDEMVAATYFRAIKKRG